MACETFYKTRNIRIPKRINKEDRYIGIIKGK